MNDPIKSFSTQFRECKKGGLTLTGAERTETAVRWKAKDGRWQYGEKEFKTREINCGKFGGVCCSSNPGCRNLRGFDMATNGNNT